MKSTADKPTIEREYRVLSARNLRAMARRLRREGYEVHVKTDLPGGWIKVQAYTIDFNLIMIARINQAIAY